MYEAIISFSEEKDGGRVYSKGMPYPQGGFVPSKGRVEYLLSCKTSFGSPVIKRADKPQAEEAEKPLDQLNKDDLVAFALKQGVDISAAKTKADIVVLLQSLKTQAEE